MTDVILLVVEISNRFSKIKSMLINPSVCICTSFKRFVVRKINSGTELERNRIRKQIKYQVLLLFQKSSILHVKEWSIVTFNQKLKNCKKKMRWYWNGSCLNTFILDYWRVVYFSFLNMITYLLLAKDVVFTPFLFF